MIKKPNPREQWNNYSSKYADVWTKGARVSMRKSETDFIKKFVYTDVKKILDVGCGTGRIVEEYCSSGNNLEIYGIDIAEKMVEFCRQKQNNHPEIKAIEICDISHEAIPFNSNFNLVSAIRVFKYNENWKEILGKLLDSCLVNGVVVFTIPNSRSINRLSGFANTILGIKNNYLIYRSNVSEIKKTCINANGKVIEISSFSKIPDFFYDLSENKFYSSMVLFLEHFLEILFGKVMFGKELFIAVKKK